jgi:hypothetical protein
MFKSNLLRLSLVLSLGAFGVACSDDDVVVTSDAGATDTAATDGGTTDLGTADTMEDGGMEDGGMEDGGMEDGGMEDGGMEDGGMEDGGMEDTGAEANACTNDADTAVLADGGDEAVAGTAGDCGLGCLGEDGEAAQRECAITCIVADHALSNECAGCYGDIVACSIRECLAPCATDPGGEACATCQVEAGCVDAFNTCTGLGAGEE